MWVGGTFPEKKKKKKTGWEIRRKKSSKTKPEIRAEKGGKKSQPANHLG
jgi:hypothetical protein